MRLCLALFLLPAVAAAQSPVKRTYRTGERYKYQLETTAYRNGTLNAVTVAVCEITVVDSAGVPWEEVRWLSNRSIAKGDTTDHTADALATPAYRISLHDSGALPMPPLRNAAMTGAITDFNTFYVAVGKQSRATELVRPGMRLAKHYPVKGDFANGTTILKGEDCLQISVAMTGLGKSTIRLQTDFMPPAVPCLQFLLPGMEKPVAGDTLNNFQMQFPAGQGLMNFQYGREYFIIRSTLQRKGGYIREAVMENGLKLQLKLNCKEDGTACAREVPFEIYREVRLKRIM
ncbi:hypothetical protein [Chitinophaga deserti]|uniref:hypothetical protein n=1 Tax=Chitinophaga deserti TaxID=2164099 RepID=UPI000D6CC51F|nr:hypothetical protein [Chitinophaga deserti]